MTISIPRSFVIPVLDFSPHSPYNIRTLLDDLKEVPGEVVCVFNSHGVFEQLRTHPRIDKFCFNSQNAGVSRSWNMGINLAEGKAVYILNADLHIELSAFSQMEEYLFNLEKAVAVGPEGSYIDYLRYPKLKGTNWEFPRDLVSRHFGKGQFSKPAQTHAVCGYFFAIHLERFLKHGLMFDVELSPCFVEEWDFGLQVIQAGLACYVVPVVDYSHDHWGVSAPQKNTIINYLGKSISREEILQKNVSYFVAKWLDA